MVKSYLALANFFTVYQSSVGFIDMYGDGWTLITFYVSVFMRVYNWFSISLPFLFLFFFFLPSLLL